MRALASLCLLIALTACATHPVATSEAREVPALQFGEPRSGASVLIVKRDRGLMGAACKVGVYVDGTHVGQLGTSQKLVLYLPPGAHMIGARNGALCGGALAEASVSLSAGSPLIYRIAIGDAGAVFLQPTAF